jgi:hypothetical protein
MVFSSKHFPVRENFHAHSTWRIIIENIKFPGCDCIGVGALSTQRMFLMKKQKIFPLNFKIYF